jgi:hypothetical protein
MRRLLVTFCCLVIATPCARCQSPEEKLAAVSYLRKMQGEDGGFRLVPGEKTSLRATSSALRALRYFGGSPTNPMACIDYVKSCWDDKEGGFGEHDNCPARVYATAVGLMALVELKVPTAPYADAAVKYLGANATQFEDIRIAAAGLEAIHRRPKEADAWIKTIEKMRNPDGTFGKGDGQARDTGGVTACLLRLGVKVDDPAAVVKVLDAGQRKDGGFGKGGAASDLESTYRVVRCYVMLKARPAEVEKCLGFIARCRNADGGYGVAPGQPSTVAGTYFAGILLHWLHEK